MYDRFLSPHSYNVGYVTTYCYLNTFCNMYFLKETPLEYTMYLSILAYSVHASAVSHTSISGIFL